MLSGNNVFLTGAPGSGKTHLLNDYIRLAKSRRLKVAVTATTGIAATHLDGITIHSWAGIGISSSLTDKAKIKMTKNLKLVNRYRSTDVLVIDEVSMLDGARLDLINEVAKLLTGKNQPMGGIQVILVGDLFQLPPVSKNASQYIFESSTWSELNLKICYLTEQHRQQLGDELNLILQSIRSGKVRESEMNVLSSKISSSKVANSNVLKLYSHNFDVDAVNDAKLAKLSGRVRRYKLSIKGSSTNTKKLKDSILSPETLSLKKGCQVIFTANNYKAGYFNGDRGRVVDFKAGYPVVRLHRRLYMVVMEHNWRSEADGMVLAEASQIPLRLAWAITIHKSQGMSLDDAEIDLSRAFSPGMGYVALSRLRNIDGLYLLGLNKMSLHVDSKVCEFDRRLREQSDKLVLRLM